VDRVRIDADIWQRPGRVSVGCDTCDYPTSEYISCNRDLYMPQSRLCTVLQCFCLCMCAGVMSVDHVRIWQRPSRVSVGCDTPDYPTSEYISCNRDLYMPESEKGTWKFVYCGAFKNVVSSGGDDVVAACSVSCWARNTPLPA
jgi:hypothetical protein